MTDLKESLDKLDAYLAEDKDSYVACEVCATTGLVMVMGEVTSKANIDIQLLGIGANGHIGFNEPGTSFDSETLIVTLKEKTRLDNSRFFDNDINQVPTHAITMGIKNIMNAKSVLLVASGSNKAQAIKNLMEGPITEDFPASALNNHKGKVIVVADEEACALLSK